MGKTSSSLGSKRRRRSRKSGPSAGTGTLYNPILKRQAPKSIAGLPNAVRERVTRAVEGLANDPHPPGHRKLRGREGWRIRVGDYRIVYEIDENSRTVTVLQAEHRRDVYRIG